MGMPYEDTPFSTTIASVPVQNPSSARPALLDYSCRIGSTADFMWKHLGFKFDFNQSFYTFALISLIKIGTLPHPSDRESERESPVLTALD